MPICLIALKTEPRNPPANLERPVQCLAEAVYYRPDLVCLPECTFTGHLYDEDDLERFAEPIPGPITEQMGPLARKYATHLCFGLLEVAESGVYYNSAVLLDRTGKIILRHRKIEEKPPLRMVIL